jgi:hypothetical protein
VSRVSWPRPCHSSPVLGTTLNTTAIFRTFFIFPSHA